MSNTRKFNPSATRVTQITASPIGCINLLSEQSTLYNAEQIFNDPKNVVCKDSGLKDIQRLWCMQKSNSPFKTDAQYENIDKCLAAEKVISTKLEYDNRYKPAEQKVLPSAAATDPVLAAKLAAAQQRPSTEINIGSNYNPPTTVSNELAQALSARKPQ